MTELSIGRSQLVWSGDRKVGVHVNPGVFKNSPRICEYLRGDIRITGQWHIQKPPPILVLHLVCNGAGPTFFLTAFTETNTVNQFEELARLHKSFLEGNRCLVVAMGEDTELFLAPVQSPSNVDELRFWGYAAMRGAVAHVTEMLDTGRIPLVFDLDETLVLAHTIFSLKTRQSQIAADIDTLKDELEAGDRLEVLKQEQETVEEDIEQLKMFTGMDKVVVDGQTISAQHELAEYDGQVFLRPVVRTEKKIFTRIDPIRNDTSMLIRIRDGWDDLSKYLRGEGTPDRRQRFKIWVCTAAERGYALEAWRLLDEFSELIPKKEIKSRLVCSGKQKKSLFKTFGIGPFHSESIPPEVLVPGKKLGPLSEGYSEMSMAIIADDRLEVWEKRNQDQILQITPFNYKDVKKKKTQDDGEILRMQSIFQQVRSNFYYEMLEVMGPVVDAAVKRGFQNEAEVQLLQEKIKRGASVVDFLTMPLNPPLAVPTAAPQVVQKPEIVLKPTDPRAPSDLLKARQAPLKRKNPKPASEASRKRTENRGIKRPAQALNLSETEQEIVSIPPTSSVPVKQDNTEKTESQKQENSEVRTTENVVKTSSPMTEELVPSLLNSRPMELPPVQPVYTIPPAPAVVSTLPSLQTQETSTLPPAVAGQLPLPLQVMPAAVGNQTPGQIQILPGNVVLAPNLQQTTPSNNLQIYRLPNGKLVQLSLFKSVQTPRLETTNQTSYTLPGPNVRYVLQQPSHVNQPTAAANPPPPVAGAPLQVQSWNPTQWMQQKQQTFQLPTQGEITGTSLMSGSFQRQLNLPTNVQILTQQCRNLQGVIQQQPHQLELPRVAVVQTTGKNPESTNLAQARPQQQILMVSASSPLVLPLSQNPVLQQEQDNRSKTVSPPEQQIFYPVAHPQTSQPFTVQSNDRINLKGKQRQQHPMLTRNGPGKVMKRNPVGEINRLQKGQRNNRELSNNRKLTRSGIQGQVKTNPGWNPNKKQKQINTNAETQDFNLSGYMAQLEDELEEQEASEEGEIRE